MAIPHPSQLLSPRQRLILRSSLAIAVLSITYLGLIYGGALPSALRPAAQCPPVRTQPGPACPACPPAAGPGQPAAAVAPEQPTPAGGRYSVCEAESGESIVRVLQLTAEGAAALGVHCGSSVHVLAFDHDEPQRIARFAGRGSDRGLTEHAGALSVL